MRCGVALAIVCATALALGGCATTAMQSDDSEEPVRLTFLDRDAAADQVIAAERAFAASAASGGQWTAFRATAATDAIMFAPQPVNAQQWLAGRADPPASVRWQPADVWVSCDATLAVTTGPWQRPDGTHGYFTTVWQRQDDGGWKWVLDHGDILAMPATAAAGVQTHVPPCPMHWAGTPVTLPPDPLGPSGASRDGSMRWTARIAANGARHVTISVIGPNGLTPVIDNNVAADAP